jgi:hypothetical protein
MQLKPIDQQVVAVVGASSGIGRDGDSIRGAGGEAGSFGS